MIFRTIYRNTFFVFRAVTYVDFNMVLVNFNGVPCNQRLSHNYATFLTDDLITSLSHLL